jgi:hypothetical protein
MKVKEATLPLTKTEIIHHKLTIEEDSNFEKKMKKTWFYGAMFFYVLFADKPF